jgi:hypothetical protein
MGQSRHNCKPKIEFDDYTEFLGASGYIPVPAEKEERHKKGMIIGGKKTERFLLLFIFSRRAKKVSGQSGFHFALVCRVDFVYQGFDVAGLQQVVEGAEPYDRHGRVDCGVPAEDDHLGGASAFTQVLENFDAVHAGHFDIQQNDVVSTTIDFSQSRSAVGRGRRLDSFGHEDLEQGGSESFLVVDDKDSYFFIEVGHYHYLTVNFEA